ncbi:MAG TPA: AAA family ATPase [Solirubrobacteraceae bacterium]|jgi:chromosome segregation protein|nr:AAA family ATPase [Solirubrobacteraceae bacterium]
MRLKSLTLKGFKSFPDRTTLDFGPGVSVVVGPNGSGKSNVTDAVLWAMGEQSPLAVRGQSMQDVIFGGGHGVQPRSAAEVEIVLDNSDGTVSLPLSEISIARRLDRTGDGGYRLNGARCRLTDVIEVLSDTGLGKENHSVISQGRVEQIVTSKARDRRLLIEEAAGLGKHRKRRRRAQLKLERTQENLDRALDVEREARTRLRPLKRQAEAAELHERLERQILQARWELARDAVRRWRIELAEAERNVAAARAARGEVEATLAQTIERRGHAERALSEYAERRDALSQRAYECRSAHERLELRGEQIAAACETLARRGERLRAELVELEASDSRAGEERAGAGGELRLAELEAELAHVLGEREQELQAALGGLEQELSAQRALVQERAESLAAARAARAAADAGATRVRERVGDADRGVERVRREAARIGAELAAANQFLRGHAAVRGAAEEDAPKALSEELRVRDGYELALAAALGGRLDAALVADVAGAESLLDRAGPDGGTALLAGDAGAERARDAGDAPVAGAQRLLDLVSGPPQALALAERLLADAWIVERLEGLSRQFAGIAVTRAGRVWFASWGEVRQLAEGGSERVLARRNERDRLIAATERAAQEEQAARLAADEAVAQLQEAEAARSSAEESQRRREREHAESQEGVRRAEWLIEQRRAAPADGPLAVRRAELEGALATERSQAARVAREAAERQARIASARAQLQADGETAPRAVRLRGAVAAAAEVVGARFCELERELAADRAAAEEMAGELRECAAAEAEIQAALRSAGETVTAAEVAAQRVRDQAAEAELELGGLGERLGVAAPAAGAETVELGEQEIAALRTRVERLTRRREQLGPVNPLAQEEYAEAIAHVEEMETRRADLEIALRELRGVIRDTDRQIQAAFEQTFASAAANFEELVGDVFPGGSGRLRLVSEEQPARAVLGGEPLASNGSGAGAARSLGGSATDDDAAGVAEAAELTAEREAEIEERREQDSSGIGQLGVEIEITPAGKSTKRLSLLSGGEKSMTALAFLFAVFLARPCPFYILDEVEAALDDLNLDRFLALLRRYADRAQFIVITHQKRTMEAADWLFGVSMGGDGVSKVVSRRLPSEQPGAAEQTQTREVAEVA